MNSLRIKDLFLSPTDFDPLQSVEPFPIPRDRGSPDVFTASFTIDEFKLFWSRERVAFQWEYRSDGGNRDISKDNPNDLLPVYKKSQGSVGRPRIYDWSIRFCCRRYRDAKVLTIRRDSVGTNCSVSIRLRKPVDKDVVQVEYRWRHNHDDSADARAKLPMGNNELNWTKAKVAEGLDWKEIKNQLQLDEEALQKIDHQEGPVPPALSISYDDVRKAIYRKRTQESRKASVSTVSVQL